MTTTTDEVVAIERGLWTQANDPAYFAEPMGFVEKAQLIKMPAEKPWTKVDMLDVEVRQITPDCVILAYHGRGSRAGDEKPYEGSIASTYCRIDGTWQLSLSAHQPWTPKT
jgi:hypothetical protein